MTTPLNQLYRRSLTFLSRPDVEQHQKDYSAFCMKKNFIKLSDDDIIIKGRKYDIALALSSINFANKTIAEVGARDSIFGSYLTDVAKKVYVSDYFEEWGKGTVHDLGTFGYWDFVWRRNATDPSKIVCETQNILSLSYLDESMDIVIATHVLNFMQNQTEELDGDIRGLTELVRICKKGGFIIISLMIGPEDTFEMGSHIYDSKSLFDRLINQSGCEIYGSYDFDLLSKHNDGLHSFGNVSPVSDAFFILKKN